MKGILLACLTLFIFNSATYCQTEDCSAGLELKYDKFDKFYTISTTFLAEDYRSILPISFSREIRNGISKYYAYVSVDYFSPKYSTKGMIILMTNGKKIIRPSIKVDCNYSSSNSNWSYSVFFLLTSTEIELFKNETVTDIRLGYVDSNDINGTAILKEYIGCLTKAKIKDGNIIF